MASPVTLFAVGTLAAQIAIGLVFRAKPQDSQGPRLSDLQISTSAFGEVIPKGYGTGPMKGDLLWLKGNQLDELRKTEKVGGGKGGGGSARQETFSYFATFIMGFGEGPASGVRRIWADKKLIFDATGANQTVSMEGLRVRFRGGTGIQEVDPDYAADVGADTAVPLRGEVTLTFIGLPLADFGNRIPNVEAEIVFESTTAQNSFISAAWAGGMGKDANSTDALQFDHLRNRLIANDLSGLLQVGAVIDGDDLSTLIRGGLNAVPEGNWICGVAADGNYYGVDNATGDNILWDPITGLEISRKASVWTFSRSVQPFRLVTSSGIFTKLAGCNSEISTVSGRLGGTTAVRIWDDDMGADEEFQPFGVNTRLYSMTERVDGSGRLVFLVFDASDASSLHLYNYQIEIKVSLTGSLSADVDQVLLGSIAATDIDPAASAFTIDDANISHDRSDDTLIISFELDSDPAKQYVVKWSETVGIIWKTGPLTGDRAGGDPLISHRENGSHNRLVGHSFAWVNGRTGAPVTDRVTQISLADGAIVQNAVAAGAIDGNNDGDSIWDDERGRLYNSGQAGPLRGVLNLLPKTGSSVAEIYRDRCRRAGIDVDNELNVGAITDSIDFFAVTRKQSERQNIEPLMALFGHSGGTEDEVLRFVPLGGTPAFTLFESDMEPGRGGEDPMEMTKVQELELPGRVSVVYADVDNGFEQGTQTAERIIAPVAATRSRVHNTLNIAGGMTARAARNGAERALIRAWNERDNLKGRPGIEFLEFTPGIDAGTITRLDGSSQRIRPKDAALGLNWSLEAAFVGEQAAQFVDDPDLEGDGGQVNQQTILSSAESEIFLLNAPNFRDRDAVADRSFSRVIWAAAPVLDNPWAGTLLYRLTGDTEFDQLAQTTTAVSWGRIAVAPPAGDQPWRTSKGSVFEAVMVTGFDDLQSVSQADFYAGVNAVYIFKPATGRGEIVLFRNFTDLGNNRGRFSDLARGERGSETAMADVAVGDTVIILDRAALDSIAIELPALNQQKRYRSVTSGQVFELGSDLDFTPLGDDLRPLHPAMVKAEQSGGDIVFTWVRRTHIGWDVFDGAGAVGLNQDSELYDLEVYDGPGGALVNTFAGLTTPVFTYSAAQIALDGFGGAPDPITIGLYQKSVQVGRGFSQETTIPTT